MSLASVVPDVNIDVSRLPALLPWSLRHELYPYSDLFPHIAKTRRECPSWNRELEAYYDTFQPDFWLFLSIENKRDARALSELRLRLSKFRQSGMNREPEDGASLVELESAIDFLQSRQRLRWDRLFGLLDIRDKYAEHQRDVFPHMSDSEIMAATLGPMSF